MDPILQALYVILFGVAVPFGWYATRDLWRLYRRLSPKLPDTRVLILQGFFVAALSISLVGTWILVVSIARILGHTAAVTSYVSLALAAAVLFLPLYFRKIVIQRIASDARLDGLLDDDDE